MAADRKIVQIDNSVVNTATPFGGMEYKRNKLHFGENIVKIYMITAYPPTLSSSWSPKLSNLPNTIFCQTFEPCDNGELLREIGRSLTRLNGVAESTRDHVKRIRIDLAEISTNFVGCYDKNSLKDFTESTIYADESTVI